MTVSGKSNFEVLNMGLLLVLQDPPRVLENSTEVEKKIFLHFKIYNRVHKKNIPLHPNTKGLIPAHNFTTNISKRSVCSPVDTHLADACALTKQKRTCNPTKA
jgi:hypothetical protein